MTSLIDICVSDSVAITVPEFESELKDLCNAIKQGKYRLEIVGKLVGWSGTASKGEVVLGISLKKIIPVVINSPDRMSPK